MKVNVNKLSDKQLFVLLAKFNYRVAAAWGTGKYEEERQKYKALMKELRQRRDTNPDETPLVIKKAPHNAFGEINRDYYNRLSLSEKEAYLHYKWPEL